MSSTVQPDFKMHVRFWAIAFVVFLLLLWVLKDILLPFVLGMVIAYLLDPIMERLARYKLSRSLSAILITAGFAVVVLGIFAIVVPVIHSQAIELSTEVPEIVADWKEKAMPMIEDLYGKLSPEQAGNLKSAAEGFSGRVIGWLANVAKGLWSGGVALFDVLSLLIITPIVTFYLLRDWNVLTEKLHNYLPKQHKKTILNLMGQIDETLAGFIRGQGTVCLVLGLFYAIGLSLAGLKFGLVIGLISGILSFIPFVGSIFGFVAAVGVAIFQFQEWTNILIVAAIFFTGQFIEGNFLSPRLIGERVGLHALWVIFALMAAGSLFGFTGILVAIPVAAVIGVLVRFGLQHYLESGYYSGKVVKSASGQKRKKSSKAGA